MLIGLKKTAYGGFNSQRDGILLKPLACVHAEQSFNSQRDGILQKPAFEASRLSNCFNSQRDGILYKHKYALLSCKLEFQFPTGWNSTVFAKHFVLSHYLFQFPTGWNSTQRPRPARHLFLGVSIPNGMEFYKSIVGNKLGKNEFQFPTGWNSTKFPLEIVRNFLVSIPNGMEFYLRLW